MMLRVKVRETPPPSPIDFLPSDAPPLPPLSPLLHPPLPPSPPLQPSLPSPPPPTHPPPSPPSPPRIVDCWVPGIDPRNPRINETAHVGGVEDGGVDDCWTEWRVKISFLNANTQKVNDWLQEHKNSPPLPDHLRVECGSQWAHKIVIFDALENALTCEEDRKKTQAQAHNDTRKRFVQIGAFVGDSEGDHIFELASDAARGWRGILLEPNPVYFEHLCRNYNLSSRGKDDDDEARACFSKRVCALNALIAPADVAVPFYSINKTGHPGSDQSDASRLPKWASEISSLDREHLMKHNTLLLNAPKTCEALGLPSDCVRRAIEDNIINTTVDGVSFPTVFARCGGDNGGDNGGVSVLAVDAEGQDAHVIRAFPFDTTPHKNPFVIVYEHVHLSLEERQSIADFLTEKGYVVSHHWKSNTMPDTIACRI